MEPLDLRVAYVNADPLPCWPVTWGVPLAPNVASDTTALRLSAPGRVGDLSTQAQPLARHPDGSIRRLLVTTEMALPGPGAYPLRLSEAGPPVGHAFPAFCRDNGLAGAAGTIAVRSDGLFLSDARSGGGGERAPTYLPDHYRIDLRAVGSLGGELAELSWRLESFEPHANGPLVAAGVVTGCLLHRDDPLLHTRLTLQVFHRTPVLLCDVLVLNLSDQIEATIGELQFRVERLDGAWREATYEVRQLPRIATTPLPLEARADDLGLRIDAPAGLSEHRGRLLSYNETWLAAADDRSRVVVGLPGFFENYPYGVRVEPERVAVDLWPAWSEEPWVLPQGAGRTHTIGLGFLPADESEWSSRAVGYAICKPPLGHTPLATMQAGGVADELLDYLPDQYPRLETTLYDLVHNRNRGYGKMNWGDDISVLYTNQLRGAGEVVWNNLEGDYPYHLWCQFVRTGRFRYHREFTDGILHWADVDFCDHSADPNDEGALHIHSARHWTGHASPCHNWAEGFKEWYYQTGDPRPLEILGKMADWLMHRARQGFFKTDPQPYVRGCGWGLIQMAALTEALERDDIRETMLDLCARLLDYGRDHHGLAMTIPTGGTWAARDNAFHTATVVIGAWRCWRLTGSATARELALTAVEAFFDERTCTPEGIAVYISGPEQDFPMQQAAGFAMGALAVGYHLTGDERYVRRGMRMLEYCLDRGMIVDHMRIPGRFLEYGSDHVLDVALLMPNTQLLSYQLRGLLLFMRAAHNAGMLREVEYQF